MKSIFLFIDNEYLVTEVGGRCEKNYVPIQDQAECNLVSKQIILRNQALEGWSTTTSANEFKPGNNFTSGCYWNFGGKNLFFNPFGVNGLCVGPPDCRTLCKRKGKKQIIQSKKSSYFNYLLAEFYYFK